MISPEEGLQLLKEHLARAAQIRSFVERSGEILGTDPESPLFNHLHLFIAPTSECVEWLITGHKGGGSIEWFIWDNAGGARGLSAGVDGDMRPIRTPEDLYWLLTVRKP